MNNPKLAIVWVVSHLLWLDKKCPRALKSTFPPLLIPNIEGAVGGGDKVYIHILN